MVLRNRTFYKAEIWSKKIDFLYFARLQTDNVKSSFGRNLIYMTKVV